MASANIPAGTLSAAKCISKYENNELSEGVTERIRDLSKRMTTVRTFRETFMTLKAIVFLQKGLVHARQRTKSDITKYVVQAGVLQCLPTSAKVTPSLFLWLAGFR